MNIFNFLREIGWDLEDWLEKYGKDLSFESKQALIPIRDRLFDYDYERLKER